MEILFMILLCLYC